MVFGRTRIELSSEASQAKMSNDLAMQALIQRKPIQQQIEHLRATGGSEDEIKELQEKLDSLATPLCNLLAKS